MKTYRISLNLHCCQSLVFAPPRIIFGTGGSTQPKGSVIAGVGANTQPLGGSFQPLGSILAGAGGVVQTLGSTAQPLGLIIQPIAGGAQPLGVASILPHSSILHFIQMLDSLPP